MNSLSELNRRLDNLIRLGYIAEVDHAARKVRVKSGDLHTHWLPWPAEVGRNYIRWRPLRINTQVVLNCPSGDPAQAVITQILYTQNLNSPSTDPEVDLIQFTDGSYIQHHAGENSLKIHSANTLHLTATGNITINGNRVDIN